LRANGYKIAVTLLDHNAIPISEVPLDQRVAFCFGTEKEGITSELQQAADFAVHIPMYGFTQSFNISVSAALILQDVSRRLRENDIKWYLSESEKRDIMFRWLKRTVRHSHMLLKYEGFLD
jgi:tRNA (guanosine-2'-O-)-methyltransferase